MSKFKVGDKVKLVSMKNEDSFYKKYLGKIFTIKQAGCVAVTFKEATEENIAPYYYNLQKVEEYTYEDLKKSPIGTKVTFENGSILTKIKRNFYTNGFWDVGDEVLKDNYGGYYLGKIIKIEEPTYTTVYEHKPETLDEVEKRYLRGFIKPFIDDVETIRKLYSPVKDKEYIQIRYKDDRPTCLPYFKKNTMYKGMKENRHYTLEELGL